MNKIHLLWSTSRPEVCQKTLSYWLNQSEAGVYEYKTTKIEPHFAVDDYSDAIQLSKFEHVKITEPEKPGMCYPLFCLTYNFMPDDDDFIIIPSDDFYPPKNWDKILFNVFHTFGHGVYIFNDGYQPSHAKVVTIPIMTGKTFKTLNGITYSPAYSHLHSDVEFYNNIKELNLIVDLRKNKFKNVIFEHRHWVCNKREKDSSDNKCCDMYINDKTLFEKRKHLSVSNRILHPKFDKLFSILISTTNTRKFLLNELISVLTPQLTPQIEIIIDDTPKINIGIKRKNMVNAATGKYCAFIDDDDLVSRWYIGLILAAIKLNPDVIGFKLRYLEFLNGGRNGTAIHSIKNKVWSREINELMNKEDIFYRCPNHLNPVLTEIAKTISFKHLKWAEDKEYSDRLYDSLKSEIFIDDYLYYYRHGIITVGT